MLLNETCLHYCKARAKGTEAARTWEDNQHAAMRHVLRHLRHHARLRAGMMKSARRRRSKQRARTCSALLTRRPGASPRGCRCTGKCAQARQMRPKSGMQKCAACTSTRSGRPTMTRHGHSATNTSGSIPLAWLSNKTAPAPPAASRRKASHVSAGGASSTRTHGSRSASVEVSLQAARVAVALRSPPPSSGDRSATSHVTTAAASSAATKHSLAASRPARRHMAAVALAEARPRVRGARRPARSAHCCVTLRARACLSRYNGATPSPFPHHGGPEEAAEVQARMAHRPVRLERRARRPQPLCVPRSTAQELRERRTPSQPATAAPRAHVASGCAGGLRRSAAGAARRHDMRVHAVGDEAGDSRAYMQAATRCGAAHARTDAWLSRMASPLACRARCENRVWAPGSSSQCLRRRCSARRGTRSADARAHAWQGTCLGGGLMWLGARPPVLRARRCSNAPQDGVLHRATPPPGMTRARLPTATQPTRR